MISSKEAIHRYLNIKLVGILRTKPSTPACHAIQAIQCAFDAGVEAVEITSNSDHWQEVISECVKRQLNIGVGSVKNKNIAQDAIDLGAQFLVCPGFFEDSINIAKRYSVPVLPGIFTEDDLNQAIKFGVKDVKFFPSSVKTHEELFKAIKEPFRDEFDELINNGWEISAHNTQHSKLNAQHLITSSTEFYKLYLDSKTQSKNFPKQIVIKLPEGNTGFERLQNFASKLSEFKIRTYAVGGINDKNINEVITKYGAYGACPGSGMLNADAILKGDFDKVKTDVKKHVEIVKGVLALVG